MGINKKKENILIVFFLLFGYVFYFFLLINLDFSFKVNIFCFFLYLFFFLFSQLVIKMYFDFIVEMSDLKYVVDKVEKERKK